MKRGQSSNGGTVASRQERRPFDERWVAKLIREAKAEEAANPMTREEFIAQAERFSRDGEKLAKKLGIKTDVRSATRIIHAWRKAQRSRSRTGN